MLVATLTTVALLWSRYDYGAYKIITAGYAVAVILMLRGWQQFPTWGRALTAAPAIAALYLTVIPQRLVAIDMAAKYKSVAEFSGMLKDLPPKATVALRIADPLSFEWAIYYLRFHDIVPIIGALVYLPHPDCSPGFVEKRMQSAQYVLSDQNEHGCVDAPIWQSRAYRLFKLNPGCGNMR
jgi:hypothetical protein